jgi:hypothetical protein
MNAQYIVQWAVDPDLNWHTLLAMAEPAFGLRAADDGVRILGPVTYRRPQPGQLVAWAAAEPDPHAGRTAPWADRETYRDDLLEAA